MYVNNSDHIPQTVKSTDSMSEQRQTKDILGKDDFLNLLVTQLRYQDPINPIEDKEFIAQLAQFSSLEQMQNLNENMYSLMESQQKLAALGQATTMLGKTVELHTNEGESIFGKVTGAQFTDGWPKITVEGKNYDFSEVVSILEGSKEDG